ncbi:MAG: TRAP transporter large permease subunit, partial [Acetobacteraceae bacterium]|nr:TRAP transporter large permease subunit [Acetobacteraceae bacterium]
MPRDGRIATIAGAAEQGLARADQTLGLLIEIPAAAAVAAEVVILLIGVIARFVFDSPLVWSDELASIVFLWLAMLGSAASLRRDSHMRLTTVVARLSPAARARLEALAILTPLLFLLLMAQPSLDFAQDQSFVETPALGWSELTRAAAIPVGFLLMALVALLRLLREGWRDLLIAAGALAVIAALLYAGQDWIRAIGNWNLALFFAALVGAGVLLGVPIAFCFGLATVAYLLCTSDTPVSVVAGRLDEGMSSLILLAVPLFVLLGALIEVTGMARAMVAFLANLLGHVRGGLSIVLLGAMLLVSGISGSKAADMAAVAPVLFPEMKRRGMDEGEMISLLAAAGAMSETIPPSLVLIAVGSVTGVSIAALFTGGLLPGIVLALVLAVVARQRSSAEDRRGVRRPPVRVVLRSLAVAVPALVLPVLIRAA